MGFGQLGPDLLPTHFVTKKAQKYINLSVLLIVKTSVTRSGLIESFKAGLVLN